MNTYNLPNGSPNVAVVTRDLTQIINDPNKHTGFQKYPEDFELYEIGEFDENTGEINTPDKPNFILTLSELKSQPEGLGQNV